MQEPPPIVGADPVAEFVLRFLRAGHHAGYPTADLEERGVALASALGRENVQIAATPTIIDVSFGKIARQRSYSLRVRPSEVDLDAIEHLDGLVQRVLDGHVPAVDAIASLDQITSHRLERSWPVVVGAYALAGAALTPVIGGGWRESIGGAIVGLLVGVVALTSRLLLRTEAMVAPVAAVTAGFCAAVLAKLGLKVSPDIVALAAVVTFLPGMTLTIGMRELATEHLQSGVANTANALVQLLGLVVGVGIGRSVAENWFGVVKQVAPQQATITATHVVAAAAAGIAFTITLRASSRSAPVMCAATVIALVANDVGRAVFGAEAGVFIAALAVGLAGGLLAAVSHRSALVFIVPGVLMLVPGSAGFRSVLQLLTGQTVNGVAAGFDTFVTAMSIAYGLMVSTVLLPRRFSDGRRPGADD